MANRPTPPWNPMRRSDLSVLRAELGNPSLSLHRVTLRRLTLPLRYGDACELAGLPRPVDLVSLWYPYPDDDKDEFNLWRALHRELNLRGELWNSSLQYRDFLFRVWWDDGRPPLMLVGDARVVVHKGTCEALTASRCELEEAGHEVRALLVGTAECVRGGQAVEL